MFTRFGGKHKINTLFKPMLPNMGNLNVEGIHETFLK